MPRRPLLLVVEDDHVLRDLYRVTLSLSNFAVHACEDGLDALHYLDQSRPDVIVLDLDLPRVSGTVLYDEIRARRRADRVPIVVVTGVPEIPPLPEAVVLRKPVTPDQLIRAIESTLTRRDREWIYARGKQSVLVMRIAFPGPSARIFVFGAVSITITEQRAPALRAAKATPCAALPALTVHTPAARAKRGVCRITFHAPRILNDPVSCRLSHLKKT